MPFKGVIQCSRNRTECTCYCVTICVRVNDCLCWHVGCSQPSAAHLIFEDNCPFYEYKLAA